MNDHKIAVIPLTVGVTLMVVGMVFGAIPIIALAMGFVIYGGAIHSNNVKLIRQQQKNIWKNTDRILG